MSLGERSLENTHLDVTNDTTVKKELLDSVNGSYSAAQDTYRTQGT